MILFILLFATSSDHYFSYIHDKNKFTINKYVALYMMVDNLQVKRGDNKENFDF